MPSRHITYQNKKWILLLNANTKKKKVIGIWFSNEYLKLRNLKLYLIKSNISTFYDFEIYLFSTDFFSTL